MDHLFGGTENVLHQSNITCVKWCTYGIRGPVLFNKMSEVRHCVLFYGESISLQDASFTENLSKPVVSVQCGIDLVQDLWSKNGLSDKITKVQEGGHCLYHLVRHISDDRR